MKKLQIYLIILLTCICGILIGQTPLPYQTDFESGEGYLIAPLSGQNTWVASAMEVSVDAVEAASGMQSVFIPAAPDGLSVEFPFQASLADVLFIDYMAIFPVADGELSLISDFSTASLTAWKKNGIEAELYLLNGDGLGSSEWIASGRKVPASGPVTDQWHRLTYRMDFADQIWDLYLDGTLLAADLNFVEAVALLDRFVIVGDTQESIRFDSFSVGESNPLFTDSDQDGIPDDWENQIVIANPGDVIAGVADVLRDDDFDGDLFSNLEEYLNGTNPTFQDADDDLILDTWEQSLIDAGLTDQNADGSVDIQDVLPADDFDQDGLSNGDEYTAGLNPLYPDSDNDGRSDSEEFMEGTNPLDGDDYLAVRLAQFRLNTAALTGERGQLPVVASGLENIKSWLGGGVISREEGDQLGYRLIESDGSANLNLRRGTIRLWYKPDWDSGTGPGYFTRLFGSGIKTVDNSKLWWSLYLNPDGTRLNLEVWDGAGTKKYYFGAPLSLEAGQWYEIVVTYAEDAVRCYLNGAQIAANLGGMTVYPEIEVLRQEEGFRIAADYGGVRPVQGVIDEIEIFNYPQSAETVAERFHMIYTGDTDGDGVSDLDECVAGLDPTYADTDNDGRSDSEEFIEATNPLDGDDFQAVRLSRFDMNSVDLSGERGQLPVVADGLETASGWLGQSVALRESGDRLVYQLMEQDGSANFNMRRGSIRLWLNPDWDSGTGPGYFTQLLGSGIKTVDNTKLWWSLYFNPDGTRLNLEVWDGAGTKKYYWGAPMSLEAGQWYEIVVTFAEDAVRCYVNAAQVAANLEGMTVYPGVDALKLENEFRIASDEGGVRPFRGMISELEFFNSSLSPTEIIANYNADGDILPDRWEQQIIDAGLGDVNGDGTVDVADVLAGDDFDGDLLTNEEEFQQGRNPHVFDDIIAPEPGVIEYSMNTTEGAYLQWSAATDLYGIETYQILVDGVSVYETTSTQAAITGLLSGTEYQLSVKAIDPSGNEAVYDPVTLTTAAEPAVPAPWQVQRIGQPGTVQNSIAYDAVADRYNIVAGFGFIAGKSDQYYSLHRQASGDFELSVNLELWQSDNDNAYAGLVVRESLSPKAVRFAYLGISDREARVSYRHVEAAESSTVSVAGVQAPAWIRIVRKGNLFSAYSSEDGEKWLLGHSRYVEMSEDVYVGFGAASKMEVSGAVFSHLSLKLMSDSDGDGVSDEEELTNGTDPDKKDTDGDGFSDYDEIYKLFSDPLKKDLGKTEVLQELAASAYSNLSGNWQTVGDTVNSRETRGTLDYEINVRKDGVYLVEVEFASLKNPRGNPIHRLVVSLAGSQLGTINKLLDEGETGVGYVVTPWLNKGKHHVSILWDNVRHDKTIKIKSVRLVKVDGKDKDKNKIPDWVDHRLESGNGADLSAEFSYVSPYCLEGKARFVNGLTITADKKKEIKVYPAPNSGWYADVPLDAKDSTAIKIQFENKAYHEKHKIKWESLNLLEMEELEAGQLYQDAEGVFRLREGDSLNLTASKKVKKEKPAKDPVQIEVILWEDGVPGEPVTYREKEKKAVIHQFMQPGLYTVTGTYLLKDKQDKKITRKIDKVQQDLDEELLEEMPKDKKIKKLKKELQKLLDKLNDSIDPDELEQTIMVQVSGDYFTESPVVELGRFRQWNNPEIGSPVSLEFGDTVQWEDVTSENDQGTQLELAIETLEPAHGVVRIAENEAILDHVEVRPLEIYSGWEVLFRVAEKYADGSDVIEMGVVLSEVYPDVQIEFRMIIGGVVFEDGSTNLILGPDDFDEQGRATIKFLRPGTVDLTVCHQMYVLQNGKRITEK